jgi:alkane 1-monooxygenase
VPQLPAGYYAMFLLAYIPPLWFRVMDKKVLNWAENDINRINVLAGKRDYYQRKITMATA